jgi:transposase
MKKSTKSTKTVKLKSSFSGLSVINPNSAGIDVGSKEHWVAVSPHLTEENVRSFSAMSYGLHEISAWLKECGVETVAMESTGVYWIPLHDILEEDGFEVFLCNASYVKNLPGRKKTDAIDCAWIQKLHSFGLLSPSFIPSLEIRELKDLLRYRETLTKENTTHVNRMQKCLIEMNVLLNKVVSNIMGKTGKSVIKAIIAGQTDPSYLIKFKDRQVQASDEQFLRALEGNYQKSKLIKLSTEMELYEQICHKIDEMDRHIEMKLMSFLNDCDDIPINNKLSPRELLILITGVDLTEVPGFDVLSVWKLISETGLDMSKWPDAKHFTSWLRLAPNNQISGGKLLKSNTVSHKPKATQTFRICATTLKKSKTYLGYFYRKKKAQKSASKAIIATARKLAEIYYKMLKFKASFNELGENFYEQNYREKAVRNLKRTAHRLGFELTENSNVINDVVNGNNYSKADTSLVCKTRK